MLAWHKALVPVPEPHKAGGVAHPVTPTLRGQRGKGQKSTADLRAAVAASTRLGLLAFQHGSERSLCDPSPH